MILYGLAWLLLLLSIPNTPHDTYFVGMACFMLLLSNRFRESE